MDDPDSEVPEEEAMDPDWRGLVTTCSRDMSAGLGPADLDACFSLTIFGWFLEILRNERKRDGKIKT